MEAVITTSAAICHALMQGPRYGRDIIRLLNARARGVVNPRPGTVYRAFASLVRKGHVRRWTVVPRGHRGARAREYYELTPKGIASAERQREALAQLLELKAPPPPIAKTHRMGDNLRRAAEVSAFARKLLLGMRHASGRRS
jgi:DNA-binding PadR family transcriptional regulator